MNIIMKKPVFLFLYFLLIVSLGFGQTLKVKEGWSAILKTEASGNGEEITRIPSGTEVAQLGQSNRYYSISYNGQSGWAYKGGFNVLSDDAQPNVIRTKESLLARTDLLHIILVDVEKGDATLIICPEADDGQRDLVLIDAAMKNDADRIKGLITSNGFDHSAKPITRLIITHQDLDHMASIELMAPLVSKIYDNGPLHQHDFYQKEADKAAYNRETMKLSYVEQLSGGVSLECVAVNNATDNEPNRSIAMSKKDKNDNSIALILSYFEFDYFTGGDLTFEPEESLARGNLKNCDVYHVNHHGSSKTSSGLEFVKKLDPEVSVVSNGTQFGHPTSIVANRLINEVGSVFFQTNVTDHPDAHQPDPKYVADDTLHQKAKDENNEGATGNIHIVVDPELGKYYVIMPGLDLADGTFDIEQ